MANAQEKQPVGFIGSTDTFRLKREDIHPPDQDIMLTSQPEDKYTPIETVGEGAMKAVIKMHDRDAARKIAMAVMLDAEDEDAYYRFLQEARITANLEHPNIVPVHDIGLDREGHLYFTMKLVGGESLGKIIERLASGDKNYRAGYSLHQLLIIFRKVCDAISFAHARGVIHLDLKPDNIQVGPFGEVLVLDWGLSRFIGDSEESASIPRHSSQKKTVRQSGVELTLDGIAKGTPGYMAPEQAAGRNREKDHRTDLYALGAILYTILTWKWPIEGNDIQKMLKDTIKGKIVSPKNRAPGRIIPLALEAVVMKAMALEPDARYQSASALAKDIDAYMGGFATSAERTNLFIQLWLLVKRHRAVSSVLLGSLLVIVAVVWNFMLGINVAKNEALKNEKKAFEALSVAQKEQEERLKLAMSAAPRFVAEAKKCFETGNDAEAMKELKTALTLDKNSSEAWLLYGRMMLAEESFAKAFNAFAKVKSIDCEKYSKIAKDYAVLTQEQERTLLAGERVRLGKEIDKAGDIVLAARLLKNANPDRATLTNRIEAARVALKELHPAEKNLRFNFRIYDSGSSEGIVLDITGNPQLHDLSPLKGLPISDLSIYGTAVSDLSPLQDMPLRRLWALGNKITDLSPLKGMPLQDLNIQATSVLDLSPLLNMPLKKLYIANTKISDISPLRNMPLEVLDISGTAVSDFSVIKGFPLVRLSMSNTAIKELSILKNCELRELNISGTPVSDIGILCEKPLESLSIESTQVNDISLLKGKPLLVLRLSDTAISDLSPLKGMPLKVLALGKCKNINDLTVLKELPLLEELELPAGAKNIEFLRKKPGLLKIGFGPSPGAAADFWRKWDEKQKK
ncbi:MAG: hypothetical protein A2X49_08900 [Lentisphaerae bacterium GWF2_52_8]|nr:MAG: hypothetical protein A2X49_08900 [Lentisphaerae bacterium GWF2_52_8]